MMMKGTLLMRTTLPTGLSPGKRVAGPYRDMVLLNAAAAFLVGEKVETLREGIALAAEVIDDGRAAAALDGLIAATNG